MWTVRPISEAEMIALFLATEYPSPRTHQQILQVLQYALIFIPFS